MLFISFQFLISKKFTIDVDQSFGLDEVFSLFFEELVVFVAFWANYNAFSYAFEILKTVKNVSKIFEFSPTK